MSSKITWNADVNAPGCLGEILSDTNESILIQTDLDAPGVANSFGWSTDFVQICTHCGNLLMFDSKDLNQLVGKCDDCNLVTEICSHDNSDGSIDCTDCGVTASDFISAATLWLEENNGIEADDPGYFSADSDSADSDSDETTKKRRKNMETSCVCGADSGNFITVMDKVFCESCIRNLQRIADVFHGTIPRALIDLNLNENE